MHRGRARGGRGGPRGRGGAPRARIAPLHNAGVFYAVRITGGTLRPEPGGNTAEPVPVGGLIEH
ncbi:hypothetical protein ACOKM3_36035 [Streptomyces sp. BH106]|uniref:hypothetical protein n=1 Tax=Streptomyces sp. BH106 TaxID=3410409 RepID=UPI003CFA8C91